MGEVPATTEVLIVGAGPTGLTLATLLASKKISFILVDRLAEGANTSRAAVVHARTLEVLDEIQVSDRLRAQGHVVPRFTLRDRDRVLATIRFDRLPTRYPFTLMIPQNATEAILLARLSEVGGTVRRPLEATDLRQDADGVTATFNGPPQTIRARYAVGADGMHSIVRERAGIAFTGARYEESFVLADVRMDWPIPADEVMLFFSPGGLVVVAPLPGGRYRVVATIDEAPEHPSLADVQTLLDARGPTRPPAKVHEVVWGSRFRVHHRVADAYRSGRIFLAGDAAHVHSPAGGQGMNTGIQDAVALGQALAGALADRAGENGLDEYERRRRPVAQHVVALTDKMTRVATLKGAGPRSVRNALLGLVGSIPFMQRRIATELAELRYR